MQGSNLPLLLGRQICHHWATSVCMCMLSRFSHYRLFLTPWAVACQAPLSMGSLGKNTGVGCYALLQGIFPTQESNLPLLCLLNWQAGSLPTSTTWEALFQYDSVRDMAFLVAQIVKNLCVRQETCIQFLGWEDPLEEDVATNGSILAWKIPRTEEPGRLQSMGSQRVWQDWETNTYWAKCSISLIRVKGKCDTGKVILCLWPFQRFLAYKTSISQRFGVW